MDAEAPEHGVGFPTTEEHDGVLVDVSAEQGGSAARAERASAEEVVVDARGCLNGLTSVAESVRDEARVDYVPLLMRRVRVEVVMDRCAGRGLRLLKVEANPS